MRTQIKVIIHRVSIRQ